MARLPSPRRAPHLPFVTLRAPSLVLLLAPLALAACEHPSPGALRMPTDVGPWTTSLPRRLTFYALNDRNPSVTNGVIAFARTGDAYAYPDYTPYGREECLAFLPVEGGTITKEFCPSLLLSPADTFVNTWFEPSVSPDGKRLAYTWQRGSYASTLSLWEDLLVVTSADRPTDTTQIVTKVNYIEPGVAVPRHSDIAAKVSWVGNDRIRFLATWERIFKVKANTTERKTDTTYVPLALMEMDLATKTLAAVPGGDSVIAYAAAPAGGIWVVREGDPSALLLLDPATGARTPVGRFSTAVIDLAAIGGLPVAVVSPVYDTATGLPTDLILVLGGAAIERLDPATATSTYLTGFTGPVHRIVDAGNGRFVAEIEQANVGAGVSTDLWLLEFPPS